MYQQRILTRYELDILKSIAKNKRPLPLTFREISQVTGIKKWLVGALCRQLAEEGLLRIIRKSGLMFCILTELGVKALELEQRARLERDNLRLPDVVNKNTPDQELPKLGVKTLEVQDKRTLKKGG